MNLKTCLFLNLPYRFKNVCNIYPISLEYAIKFDNDIMFATMFMPYMLSKDVLTKDVSDKYSMFEIVLSDDKLCSSFIATLCELCKTDNIKFNDRTKEIFIDEFTESLNKDNFDEFSNIVLEIVQLKKMEKNKDEPIFETEDGRKRWLALQKSRKDYQEKHKENELNLYDMMNVCQFGGDFYISDSELLKWSYWKLVKTYSTIINRDSYKNAFSVYLQGGDAKTIEKHWSELIKL